MYCGQCGYELKENARFCSRCGASVPERNIVDTHAETAGYVDGKKPAGTKKPRKAKRVLAIAAAACCLFALGGIGTFIYRQYFAAEYLAVVANRDGKFGYIDEKGELVIDCVYDIAFENWIDGVVCAGTITGTDENGDPEVEYGLIDRRGEVVVPFQYDAAAECEIGDDLFAVAKKKGTEANGETVYKWGFINAKGEQITDFQYEYSIYDGFPFDSQNEDGLIVVSEKTDARDYVGSMVHNYGVIDSEGEEIIPLEYQKIKGSIDENEKAITLALQSDIEENIGLLGQGALRDEDLICVGKLGSDGLYTYGYINYENEEVIPLQYEDATAFADNGLAAVMNQEGKWGYIDKNGDVVISFQYSEASVFADNGIARVKEQDETYSYIDETGNRVKTGVAAGGEFDENGMVVIDSGKENGCGLFNSEWETILPCEYEWIREAGDGMYFMMSSNEPFNEVKIADSNGGVLGLGYEKDMKLDISELKYGENGWCMMPQVTGEDEDENEEYVIRYVDKVGRTVLELPEEYILGRRFVKTNS